MLKVLTTNGVSVQQLPCKEHQDSWLLHGILFLAASEQKDNVLPLQLLKKYKRMKWGQRLSSTPNGYEIAIAKAHFSTLSRKPEVAEKYATYFKIISQTQGARYSPVITAIWVAQNSSPIRKPWPQRRTSAARKSWRNSDSSASRKTSPEFVECSPSPL